VVAVADEPEEMMVAVARGIDAEALEAQLLLLLALGIPHALVPEGDDVTLVVPAALEVRVREELAGLASEEVRATPPPRLRGGSRAGIPAALVLLASHVVLQRLPAAVHARIFAAGELNAARVRAGELWRAATALMLHADFAHVVGNAVATAIFVTAVGDWIGPGLALTLTILAGVGGNLVAALVDPGHHAIGFSTATFGALGLTAVLGFVARYRDRLQRRRAWLTLAAGVALLAMLGGGSERADVLAHILGLVIGALFGLVASRMGRAGELSSAEGRRGSRVASARG
jgi:membrane associated rhomboid family serine protease